MEIFIGALCFIFYVPPTVIIFRNINFIGPIRAFYSLTVVPIFIIFMFINIYFSMQWFPQLFETVAASNGASRGDAMLAAIISCPLAVLVSFLYFKFFTVLNQMMLPDKRKT